MRKPAAGGFAPLKGAGEWVAFVGECRLVLIQAAFFLRQTSQTKAIGPSERGFFAAPLCGRPAFIPFNYRLNGAHGLIGCIRRAAVDDDPLGHRTQPRELPLAELSRGENSPIAHRRVVDRSVEVFPRLSIADAAHRR